MYVGMYIYVLAMQSVLPSRYGRPISLEGTVRLGLPLPGFSVMAGKNWLAPANLHEWGSPTAVRILKGNVMFRVSELWADTVLYWNLTTLVNLYNCTRQTLMFVLQCYIATCHVIHAMMITFSAGTRIACTLPVRDFKGLEYYELVFFAIC